MRRRLPWKIVCYTMMALTPVATIGYCLPALRHMYVRPPYMDDVDAGNK